MWGYGPAGMMGGYGFGLFGWILQILFLVLIIWGIVYLLRHGGYMGGCGPMGGHGHKHGGSEDAMGILKSRYAKGEITKDEFEKMKKDIG